MNPMVVPSCRDNLRRLPASHDDPTGRENGETRQHHRRPPAAMVATFQVGQFREDRRHERTRRLEPITAGNWGATGERTKRFLLRGPLDVNGTSRTTPNEGTSAIFRHPPEGITVIERSEMASSRSAKFASGQGRSDVRDDGIRHGLMLVGPTGKGKTIKSQVRRSDDEFAEVVRDVQEDQVCIQTGVHHDDSCTALGRCDARARTAFWRVAGAISRRPPRQKADVRRTRDAIWIENMNTCSMTTNRVESPDHLMSSTIR